MKNEKIIFADTNIYLGTKINDFPWVTTNQESFYNNGKLSLAWHPVSKSLSAADWLEVGDVFLNIGDDGGGGGDVDDDRMSQATLSRPLLRTLVMVASLLVRKTSHVFRHCLSCCWCSKQATLRSTRQSTL